MFTKKVLRVAVSFSAVTALLLSSVHVLSEPIGELLARRSDQGVVNQAVRPPTPGRVDERVRHAAPAERVARTRRYAAPDEPSRRRSFWSRFFQFNVSRFLRNNGEVPAGGTSPLIPDTE